MSEQRKIGTNDALSALEFVKVLEDKINEFKIGKLTKTIYKREDIAKLKKNYDDQEERINDYAAIHTQWQALKDRHDDVLYDKRIKEKEKRMEDMHFQGQLREEQLLEARRLRYKVAESDEESQMAGIAKLHAFIKLNVESSIELKMREDSDKIEDPGKKLQKMLLTLKEQIGGDQDAVRYDITRKMQSLPKAITDQECKATINKIRVFQRLYTASGAMQGEVTAMEDQFMINRLEDAAMGNDIHFAVKAKFLSVKTEQNATFDRVATAMEKEIDKVIAQQMGPQGQGGGMNISSMHATSTQVFANAATTGQNNSNSYRGSGSLQCDNWAATGNCRFGDRCRYSHAQGRSSSSSKSEGRRGRDGERTSSGNTSRSHSREREYGGGRRPNSDGGGYGKDRSEHNNGSRSTSNNRRDRSRSREGEDRRDRSRGRDGNRREYRSRSPEGRDNRRESRPTHREYTNYSSDDGESTPKGKGSTPSKTGGKRF